VSEAVKEGIKPITSRHDPRFEVTLYRYVGIADSHTLAFYLAHGGYQAAQKALAMKPGEVIGEVKPLGCVGAAGQDSRLASSGRSCRRSMGDSGLLSATPTSPNLAAARIAT